VEFSLPNGQTLPGRILESGAAGMRVDFNHPLTDCPIEFEVEVVSTHPSSNGRGAGGEGNAPNEPDSQG
jgi:FKBP-type peptidyl-prolyl cis-trans isomerase 2